MRRPRGWKSLPHSNFSHGFIAMVFARGCCILWSPLQPTHGFKVPFTTRHEHERFVTHSGNMEMRVNPLRTHMGNSGSNDECRREGPTFRSSFPLLSNFRPGIGSVVDQKIRSRCVTQSLASKLSSRDGSIDIGPTRDMAPPKVLNRGTDNIAAAEPQAQARPRPARASKQQQQRNVDLSTRGTVAETSGGSAVGDGGIFFNGSSMTRGQLLSTVSVVGLAAGIMLGGGGRARAATALAEEAEELEEMLVWSPRAEILKRAATMSGQAAPFMNKIYPVRFVTYLARILLNYDKASRELWDSRARSIPLKYSTLEVESVRRDQFAEFAKAVQVGLLDYQGPQGVKALFSLMKSRYGKGEECKRQLAILFSFMEENQPSELIEGLLGDVDNGRVSSLIVTDPGGGYTGSVPKVTVSSSQSGRQARVRAVLRETGHLVGIRVPQPDCDFSYKTPPVVRISPPADPTGVQAEARVILDKRNGFITDIEVINPGSGYSSALAPVTVEVFGVAENEESGDSLVERVLAEGEQMGADGTTSSLTCGPSFRAEAIIDKEVGSIEIEDQGDGYATSVPLSVEIQSPAECGGRQDATRAYAVGLVAAGTPKDDRRTALPLPNTSLTFQLAQLLPSAVADTLTLNEMGNYEALDLADLPSIKAGAKQESSNVFDPVFGPVGRSPLEKESVLGVQDYLKLATAGAACNAVVRLVLHPLDCVKTTVQAEMGRAPQEGEVKADDSWLATVKGIVRKRGWTELLRGIDVSTILGFILGFIGFGGTEFFRRQLNLMMDEDPVSPVWIILMASALAQLVSCLVTCPVEAVRIRVMTCDKRPEFLSFVGTAKEMLDEEGLAYFWSGLGALLFRELPFAIAKFLTFELVRNKIFEVLPAAQESIFSALVVSILSGMLAGVAGAIVSNPADTVLTRLNTTKPPPPAPIPAPTPPVRRRMWESVTASRPAVAGAVGSNIGEPSGNGLGLWLRRGGNGLRRRGDGGEGEGSEISEISDSVEQLRQQRQASREDSGEGDWREVVKAMLKTEFGAMGLFSGLGLRAVFFGTAIALQFFAFDYFKALLKVSPDDLKLVLDVFADRLSFYTGAGSSVDSLL